MPVKIPFLPILACAAGLAAGALAKDSKPNVLLILSDDLNTDLGCYGAPVQTPHIDGFARESALFTRAYCQYPLCGPSRASFLTGQRPNHVGVTSNRDKLREKAPDVITLPQLFRQNGYFTARVGKIFHYTVPQEIGTDGEDDLKSWDERHNPKGRDVDDEDMIYSLTPGQLSGTLCWLAAEGEDREQTDGIGAEEAAALLRKSKGKPFFIAVGFYRPHTPFVAPKKYFDLYPLDKIPLSDAPSGHMVAGPEAAFRSAKPEQLAMTGDLRRQAIQAYWASVSFMDAQVGKLLDEVARLGLEKDTIIIFMSDHGYHLGDHGLWQKGSLFERTARVPFIVHVPGAKANGRSVGALVELIDLYPTLAQLCGLQPPSGLDGRSLVPLLENPSVFFKAGAVTQLQRNMKTEGPYIKDPSKRPPIVKAFDGYSLRTDRYRYTEWDEGREGTQLYDLQNDPNEWQNLAEDPKFREERDNHAKLLKELSGEKTRFP